MNNALLVWATGSIPLFASRTFLPAFMTAFMLKYPQLVPFIEASENPAPEIWLTKPLTILVLFALTIAEIWADKNPDIQQVMTEIEKYLKPAVYAIVQFGFADPQTADVLGGMNWASFGINQIFALAGMVGVFFLTVFRQSIVNFLTEMDEDGDLGLKKLISYLEDSWVLFGFFLLMIAGFTQIIILGIILGWLYFIKKRGEQKRENQKVACSKCQTKIHPIAPYCKNCGTAQTELKKIGFVGQNTSKPVRNPKKHALNLLAYRRCSHCAEKLKANTKVQKCNACGTENLNATHAKEFVQFLDKRFTILVILSVGLGFIPIIGMVLSVVLANILIISPYRKYTPRTDIFLTKIFTKILLILILAFGGLGAFGGGFILAPIYVSVRYLMSKRAFLKA